MESSTKKFSKNKFVSKKENDIFVQGLRMEPGLYFSKNRIRVAIPFNADDPQVIQAFRENKMISNQIVTQAGYDFWVINFSSGARFSIPFVTNTLPLEYWPDISQRGTDVAMPFDLCWVDPDTHKLLKKKSGRFAPESTQHLYSLLELRLNDKIRQDAVPNSQFETV